MTPRQLETFPPVTLGHIRSHGCRDLLVYCEAIWCNHSAEVDADRLPDDIVIRSLGPRMVCTACGLIGADVRPDWRPLINKPRPGSQPSTAGNELKFCRPFVRDAARWPADEPPQHFPPAGFLQLELSPQTWSWQLAGLDRWDAHQKQTQLPGRADQRR